MNMGGHFEVLMGRPRGFPALMWPKPDVPDGREGPGAWKIIASYIVRLRCGIPLIVTYFRKRQGAR